MKKVIEVSDLCCERCANRLACTLELCEGVVKAKANYKKNSIFVEVLSTTPDDELKEAVRSAGFDRPEKGTVRLTARQSREKSKFIDNLRKIRFTKRKK